MTKMLRFTNISRQDTLDMPIYISREHIVSVWEQPTDGGSLRTVIFGAGNTWYVEESVKEVIKMIEDSE